jgi:hypothetical protein
MIPVCVVASSPGHSHVFNVTRRKGKKGFLRVTLKTWEWPGDEAICVADNEHHPLNLVHVHIVGIYLWYVLCISHALSAHARAGAYIIIIMIT